MSLERVFRRCADDDVQLERDVHAKPRKVYLGARARALPLPLSFLLSLARFFFQLLSLAHSCETKVSNAPLSSRHSPLEVLATASRYSGDTARRIAVTVDRRYRRGSGVSLKAPGRRSRRRRRCHPRSTTALPSHACVPTWYYL